MARDVLRASRDIIARGSKSFATASQLLPPRERDGAHLLYAWCRHCDDRIDGQTLGHGSASGAASPTEVLADLIENTTRALAGDPVDEPPFQALQRVAARHEIPHEYPLAHLEGFAMDVRGEPYESLEDTVRYAYHVAGVVGLMMAHVMGVRDRATLTRAADLGIAFQLTNIARDVMDDAAAGRVYLPAAWLAEAAVDPGAIAGARHREGVASVVGRLLDVAERYYASADAGIERLPWRSAWSIATARFVYRDIGHLVRARGSRAWDGRARVSDGRKAYWMVVAAAHVIEIQAAGEPPARPDDLWPMPWAEE